MDNKGCSVSCLDNKGCSVCSLDNKGCPVCSMDNKGCSVSLYTGASLQVAVVSLSLRERVFWGQKSFALSPQLRGVKLSAC